MLTKVLTGAAFLRYITHKAGKDMLALKATEVGEDGGWWLVVVVKVKIAQSCLTLCDSIDYSVYGILQARILEWVPFPSPGDLPNPGIKPRSPALQADSLPAIREAHWRWCQIKTNKQTKKNAQYESCELSFIWGKMGTVTQEIAPKIALRNCNMRERGRAQLLKE